MFKIRNFALLKLSEGVFGPRLMSKSSKDSGKDSCKGGDSKKGKDKKKKDLCGRTIVPTSPRCKNKPGGSDKSKSSKDDCKKN
ncbi:uncharacterized protein LOC26534739 [Drosophila yakuba]|uniref:Uncharacterized protein n=1 Tax=Drosophila yakuba TaxID=7245 RepID=A0A0R1E243_DROYA|nr:uncharacterized protein LOC26534739 [Drosophila yakuba]KRK01303.1 uncharacterized protein Dyak_GE27558 [Drosophila yakuba]